MIPVAIRRQEIEANDARLGLRIIATFGVLIAIEIVALWALSLRPPAKVYVEESAVVRPMRHP